VAEVRTARTAELDAATLAAIERLCFDAFLGKLDEHDREHALGGTHVLVWEDGELVGHAAVVDRRLWHGERELFTGYVEAVAVIESVIRSRHELGALSATEDDGSVFVLPGSVPPDLDGELTCDWRAGDVW